MAACFPEDNVFRVKYGPRIAATARPPKPFDTSEAQHKLFCTLSLILKSWVQHLETPKLGRWFSWNQSADQQLPEFWASKMVLEWHFGIQLADPDDSAVAFDDLKRAGAVRQANEQLAALRRAGGGFQLMYRLQCILYILPFDA